jgi:zinc protease
MKHHFSSVHHWSLAPQHSAVYSLPGPDSIQRVQLSNGILVLSRANDSTQSIALHGYLPAGSLADPLEKLGLADFTASALLRGTTQRDFQQIYDALESTGASLYFGGGTHTARFSGKALSEDLGLLLELTAEALRQPVFPAEQVERLRAQHLTGLAIRAQDTAEMASLTLNQLIYPDHPYRFPEDGFPETLQAITRQDLVDFHRSHYGPVGLVIAITGGIDPSHAIEEVARVLGDWHNPHQVQLPALPTLSFLEKTARQNVTIPGKSQADILLGAPGPTRQATEFLSASLGNNILGQFGMMGRIGEVVREQAGLAYYASSNMTGGLGPGPWVVAAGVDPENIDRTIDLILQEIKRFTSEPVDPQELADSQAFYIGSLPLSMESNHGVAASLLHMEQNQLGLDYYQRYADLINSVTAELILETARQYLQPERLGIAVAGP